MGAVSSWVRRLGRGPLVAALLSVGAGVVPPAGAGSLAWPAGRGLVDQTGAAVDEARFAGRLRLVYFGYTRCPDLCPTALMTVTQALDDLAPALLARLVPVLVAADPERDGPAVLAAYLDTFHPAIVAVTGPLAVIDGLAASYAAPPIRRHDGVVDHPAEFFLVGPTGAVMARIPTTIAPDALAETLRSALVRQDLARQDLAR
ncbi:SCO family protein [Methylobacterium sp. SyP6R]|uniref:SCO family protein n=1 Tax=Methylobacterium sp. SyP6R TaxID=2718876 RepID=UPI001F2F38B6|nr:SCO family protein [Methylobacterium sp. SyP6R]MCF4124500.1 SCO family protein [Methylobacterium sp. SyP6R]